MKEKDIEEAFDQIINQQYAARKLGLNNTIVNNYRTRSTSLGIKLEVLFHAGMLRFKDDWDEE